jgi:hypothetical protein
MRRLILSLLTLLATMVALVACGRPPIAYMATPTTATPPPAHSPGCEFAVTATVPAGYIEVGTLTFGSRTLSSYRASRDPVEFKEAVRADVCRMGGDVVVTQVDAQGTIVRAAVLQRATAP